MPVTTTDILASTLPPRLTFSPTNQSAAPSDDSGTPASASFENVLASVQSTTPTATATTTPATATPVVSSDTGLSSIETELLPADLLESFFDEDPTATDTNALGLLLAAVTVNTPVNANVPVVAEVAIAATPVAVIPAADALPTETPLPVDDRSRADELRLEQNPLRTTATPLPTPTTERTATDVPEAQPTRPAEPTPSVPSATPTIVAANTTTTATTPTDTQRAASRTPAVVAQAPIVADRTQALPSEVPGVATQPIRPPAAPVAEIQQTTPITTDNPLPVNLRESVTLPRDVQAAAPVAVEAAEPFAAVLNSEVAPPVVADTAVSTLPRTVEPTTTIPASPVVQQPVAASVPRSTVANANSTSAPVAATPSPIATVPTVPDTAVAAPLAEPVIPVEAPSPQSAAVPVTTAAVQSPVVVTPKIETAPAFRESSLETKPAELTDTPTPTSTPVAGLIPQAIDPRPAVSPTAPTAPTVAAQVSESIVTHASVAERDGKVEFQIRLDPPELGPVKVKLTAVGDRLSAEVVVSNDAIRQMVESQLPDLRQRLEQAGLNLPTLDVSTGSGQQGEREAREWEQQLFGFRQAANASNGRRPTPVRTASASGTLDVMV